MSRSQGRARAAAGWLSGRPGVRAALRPLATRNLLPGAVWHRLPVHGWTTVELPGGGSFRYRGPFERELFWRGVHDIEGATIIPFAALARDARLVVDIGANTGLYTLTACAASATARVIAFEPVPANSAELERSLSENGWADRCTVRTEAVSDTNGPVDFHVPRTEYPISASLAASGYRGSEGDVIQVTAGTLDDLLGPRGDIDLVKIDVEGFEDRVLEGMQRVLTECRPAIVIECNVDGPYEAVERVLLSHDYRLFHLRQPRPVSVDRIVPDATERYRNFLAVPPGRPFSP